MLGELSGLSRGEVHLKQEAEEARDLKLDTSLFLLLASGGVGEA